MTARPNTERISVLAPAKINLCLQVGTKRPDGFHDLESLVVFAAHADVIVLERSSQISLAIEGPFAECLSAGEDNLVLRAARALAEHAKCAASVRIVLDKRIPVASGVGGGSADAAAALRGLARLWNLSIPADELMDVAASLGSDVPMCVASVPAWVEGRGERIAPLDPLPPLWLVLVNPLVGVPTGEVFRRLEYRTGAGMDDHPFGFADAAALLTFLRSATNDLQRPAIGIAPVIGAVLDALGNAPGVRLARMSGSGATCFGIVDDAESAKQCASALRLSHPDWWIVDTTLATPEFSAPRA